MPGSIVCTRTRAQRGTRASGQIGVSRRSGGDVRISTATERRTALGSNDGAMSAGGRGQQWRAGPRRRPSEPSVTRRVRTKSLRNPSGKFSRSWTSKCTCHGQSSSGAHSGFGAKLVDGCIRSRPASAGCRSPRLRGAQTLEWPELSAGCQPFSPPVQIDVSATYAAAHRVLTVSSRAMPTAALWREVALLKCENPDCRDKKLVAFSYKGRAFCPSCLGRRIWPRPPEIGKLLGAVGCIPRRGLPGVFFVDSVLVSIGVRMRDLFRVGTGLRGAVTVVQRVSSDLRLSPHFHSIVLEGVGRAPLVLPTR
jgi:hypothetical protein